MSRLSKRGIGLLLGLFATSLVLTVQGQEKQIGDVADGFDLVDVRTGDPVRLSDFEGSIVLLEFFFYW